MHAKQPPVHTPSHAVSSRLHLPLFLVSTRVSQLQGSVAFRGTVVLPGITILPLPGAADRAGARAARDVTRCAGDGRGVVGNKIIVGEKWAMVSTVFVK